QPPDARNPDTTEVASGLRFPASGPGWSRTTDLTLIRRSIRSPLRDRLAEEPRKIKVARTTCTPVPPTLGRHDPVESTPESTPESKPQEGACNADPDPRL